MGDGMYSDGGLIASNPTAVAIHEARILYPDIPIELVVSVGTGEFISEKVEPSFGWVSTQQICASPLSKLQRLCPLTFASLLPCSSRMELSVKLSIRQQIQPKLIGSWKTSLDKEAPQNQVLQCQARNILE
jgi:hypothetical protein